MAYKTAVDDVRVMTSETLLERELRVHVVGVDGLQSLESGGDVADPRGAAHAVSTLHLA